MDIPEQPDEQRIEQLRHAELTTVLRLPRRRCHPILRRFPEILQEQLTADAGGLPLPAQAGHRRDPSLLRGTRYRECVIRYADHDLFPRDKQPAQVFHLKPVIVTVQQQQHGFLSSFPVTLSGPC